MLSEIADSDFGSNAAATVKTTICVDYIDGGRCIFNGKTWFRNDVALPRTAFGRQDAGLVLVGLVGLLDVRLTSASELLNTPVPSRDRRFCGPQNPPL